MSVLTMCVAFLLFMVLVVWHEANILEYNNWSLIDTVYFWLVTFTTVGFGDKHLPLQVEIEHFTALVLCRVFGLSFLAGVIESIQSYVKYRKVILIRENKRKFKKISQILVGNSTPIAMTASFLGGTDKERFGHERPGNERSGNDCFDPSLNKRDYDAHQKDVVHRLNRISASSYTNEDEDV